MRADSMTRLERSSMFLKLHHGNAVTDLIPDSLCHSGYLMLCSQKTLLISDDADVLLHQLLKRLDPGLSIY
jgi:hypothetical protein